MHPIERIEMKNNRLITTLAAAAFALVVAACAPQAAADQASADCAKDKLATLTAGKLTIGTDSPAYAPWFVDDTPSNGKGFESAVAYAVANKLGFSKDEVVWTVAAFSSVIAPGNKDFDFDINQVSITAERKTAVDFSSGYYDVSQAIITLKDSKFAGVTTIAGLKDAKIGAQVGTTSYNTITDIIKPTQEASPFDTNDIAKAALSSGLIDALVIDAPTAFFLTSAPGEYGGVDNSKIVGQFEVAAGGEQFGLVLNKGSVLTKCVSEAVDALRADGTLASLADKWLASAGNAPILK
jgi:polar amino acid transport system substrate-binding protein